MNHMVRLLSVLILFGASNARAQNCDAFLEHGLYNVQTRTSQSAFARNLANDICRSDFSLDNQSTSKVNSVGASLGFLGLEVGGDYSSAEGRSALEIRRGEFCSTMRDEIGIRREDVSEAHTLDQAALRVYERCLELENKGVHIDMKPEPAARPLTVTYGMRQTGGGTNQLKGVYISPPTAFTCEGQVGDKVVTLGKETTARLSNETVSMTCIRNMTDNVYEAATIVLHTTDGNLTTSFERIPPLPEIQEDKAKELQAQIDAVLGRLSAFRNLFDGAITISGENVSFKGGIDAPNNTWGECRTVAIGDQKSHGFDTGDWCPSGWSLTRLDLDGCSDGGNCPIVGQATCCRP